VDTTIVACCQLAPVLGDPAANRELAAAAIVSAAARGASIVVLPELISSGYVFESKAEARACAEAPDGETVTSWARLAAGHGIVIAGSAGQAVITGASWQAAAICGAVAIALAGLATIWRGPSWPVMSARFDRAGQDQGRPPRRVRTGDSATMWESLNRDLDPTAEDEEAPQSLEDQVGGGA